MDSDATKSAIMDAFNRLVEDSSIRLGAPILVYFATHAGRFDIMGNIGSSRPISLAAYDLDESVDGQGHLPFKEILPKLEQLAIRRSDNIVSASIVRTRISSVDIIPVDSYSVYIRASVKP
jgi:hypothetical protein